MKVRGGEDSIEQSVQIEDEGKGREDSIEQSVQMEYKGRGGRIL